MLNFVDHVLELLTKINMKKKHVTNNTMKRPRLRASPSESPAQSTALYERHKCTKHTQLHPLKLLNKHIAMQKLYLHNSSRSYNHVKYIFSLACV